MSTEQPTSESWDGFLTNYLKADSFEGNTGFVVCTQIDYGIDKNDKPYLNLEVQANEETYIWSMNVTNMSKLRELGIEKPKACIGKKIGWKKVNVTNPQTKKEVESLRITSLG